MSRSTSFPHSMQTIVIVKIDTPHPNHTGLLSIAECAIYTFGAKRRSLPAVKPSLCDRNEPR